MAVVVAINKIDQFNADVDRAKQMLLNHGVQPEDYGGTVQCVPISALKVKLSIVHVKYKRCFAFCSHMCVLSQFMV